MDLRLGGKAALVTGASQGIGRAIAVGLAREGCEVVLAARREGPLHGAVEEVRSLGVRAVGVPVDVLEPEQAERLVAEAVRYLGGIDVLVNNVGRNLGTRLMDTADTDWERTFHYNLFQGVRLARLVAPHMRQRGGGSIVFIASISGWVPQLSGTLQYGASKAAQIAVVEPMALELVPDRIRVNVVSPGSILFPGGGWDRVKREQPDRFAAYERDGFPAGRLGTPEEVADVVVFLASDRARWINGAHIRVDGLEQPVPLERPW